MKLTEAYLYSKGYKKVYDPQREKHIFSNNILGLYETRHGTFRYVWTENFPFYGDIENIEKFEEEYKYQTGKRIR